MPWKLETSEGAIEGLVVVCKAHFFFDSLYSVDFCWKTVALFVWESLYLLLGTLQEIIGEPYGEMDFLELDSAIIFGPVGI